MLGRKIEYRARSDEGRRKVGPKDSRCSLREHFARVVMVAGSCSEGISNIEQGVMKAEGKGRQKESRAEGELVLLHSKFLARYSIFLRFSLPLRDHYVKFTERTSRMKRNARGANND